MIEDCGHVRLFMDLEEQVNQSMKIKTILRQGRVNAHD